MPKSLNDIKYEALVAQTGLVGHTLNDNEWAWLYSLCEGGVGPVPGDPNIVWDTTPFTAYAHETAFDANCNLYFYEGSNGQPGPTYPSSCGYYFWTGSAYTYPVASVIAEAVTPFSTGEFIVKFQVVTVVSGNQPVQLNYQPGRANQYWELFRCDIRVDDVVKGGAREEVIVDVTVAANGGGDPNNGTAIPVPGSEVTKRITLIAEWV